VLPLDDQEATPSDHADAVAEAAPRADELVVVAQSLGAFTGPLVTTRVPVARLILVAPMIPRPGETGGAGGRTPGTAKRSPTCSSVTAPMRDWGPEAFSEVFLHDVDPEVAQESESFNRAPGAGMFKEPWPLESWPDVPTRVLVPRDDRLFPLPFQRRVARERLGLAIDQIPGGHLPMLSRPRELATRLVELARA
jgi:pimeloyl-ACP methyl ester carboxylesterase